MPEVNPELRNKGSMVAKKLRNRFTGGSKKDETRVKKNALAHSKFSRAPSFNAGDDEPHMAAARAAADGYDPMCLLKSCQPVMSGDAQLFKTNMKILPKRESCWVELRGSYLLIYSNQPTDESWKVLNWNEIDITTAVRYLLCLAGCDVAIEKKDTILKFSRDGEIVALKFGSSEELHGWYNSVLSVAAERNPCLSDFDVIAPIGKGAAGRVFLVRHRGTGRKLALKAVEKDSNVFDSRSSYRHAIDERAVLGLTSGNHSFIQLRYAFQTRQNLYLVTDFCDGGDLFFYLAANQCGLDEDRARFIVAEVILAIERLHELGIVYRDLKPENILLDAQGHIRIADFGLCKRMGTSPKLARTATICGTHSYVAPEMVSAKTYGDSVDVFTIGIFMYHIMVGHPPFDANEMEDVKTNVTRLDEITYYDDFMSEDAIDLLKKVIQADPEKRLGCGAGGTTELRKHPFFSKINWEDLQNRTGIHEGGLFTGGYEIPEGMEASVESVMQSNDKKPKRKTSGWYESAPTDDDHLLRNFDLAEWEEVKVDDKDDSSTYGHAKMWPLFKYHKTDLDEGFIVAYGYSCSGSEQEGSEN